VFCVIFSLIRNREMSKLNDLMALKQELCIFEDVQFIFDEYFTKKIIATNSAKYQIMKFLCSINQVL
jgi:hypothetical protein